MPKTGHLPGFAVPTRSTLPTRACC
jgi:hypothetical protein